jgi:hypothetical protein
MRRLSVVAVVLSAAAYAQPAPSPPADPPIEKPAEPPVAWSFGAGLATGLVSLAVGGALAATETYDNRIAGSYVIMTGLTLAPVVSHLVSREWGRAAIFGSLPAFGLIGMTALLQTHPAVVDEGNKDQTRVVYVVLLAYGVLSATGGIVDSLWAGERAKQRLNLTLTPTVGAGRVGLFLGGSW